MFLKSDVDLMIENELAMADSETQKEQVYRDRAKNEKNEWFRDQHMGMADNYNRQAKRHREEAEYWKRMREEMRGYRYAAVVESV